jgi:hypothetical protein
LERPEHDTGRFTFYKLGTAGAGAAQLDGNDPNLGLVKVTFTPERKRDYVSRPPRPILYSRGDMYCLTTSRGMSGASPGGTGLSGESGQRFGIADYIEYDYSRQTTIHLRLVCRNDGSRDPRPLTSTSNPIPPRIW